MGSILPVLLVCGFYQPQNSKFVPLLAPVFSTCTLIGFRKLIGTLLLVENVHELASLHQLGSLCWRGTNDRNIIITVSMDSLSCDAFTHLSRSCLFSSSSLVISELKGCPCPFIGVRRPRMVSCSVASLLNTSCSWEFSVSLYFAGVFALINEPGHSNNYRTQIIRTLITN